ncbi:hypothetical protein HDU67_004981 [Dinochytrium kinnereticum]|nr:hypothetical protein HDU67_004981 [Dinochytrium kinnereticum]
MLLLPTTVHPYPGATLLITRTAVATVVLSAVHLTVDAVVGRKAAERLKLNPAERIFVSEKVCSTLNAVFTSVIGFKTLFFYKNALGQRVDPYALTSVAKGGWIRAYTREFDWLFPAYLGYTIYDMGTMVVQNPPSHWTMWVHHVMGATGALAMMFGRQMSIFPAYCMITEATAIFHNFLWYYQTFVDRQPNPKPIDASTTPVPPTPPSRVTTTLLGLRAASFLALRVWCAPASLVHAVLLEHRERFPGQAVGVGSLLRASGAMVRRCVLETPWYVGVPGLVMVTMFAVLNGVWSWATVKVFLRSVGVLGKRGRRVKKDL